MDERDIYTDIVKRLIKEEQGEEKLDLCRKFIYAFNNLDADMMQFITKNAVTYVVHSTLMYWDARLYEFLSSVRRERGEMKEAYVRHSKRSDNNGYYAAPYIEGIGHLRMDINDFCSELRIKHIAEIHDIDFADVVINPNPVALKPEEVLPNIVSAEFNIERNSGIKNFVINIVFDNGISGECVFPAGKQNDDTIFTNLKGYIFTDRIFRSGWVARHKYVAELSGWKCSEFGQTIEFINDCSFDASEIFRKIDV